jgi:hypothetical protein
MALISLFETIFFWQFVSVSEDQALIGLVDSYTSGIFTTCAILTAQERVAVDDVFDLFINRTIVDQEGALAVATRTAFNHGLVQKSWAYFGGASGMFAALAVLAHIQGRQIHWRHIVAENLCLVTVLGLYEWMFFHTIVFPYKSISIPELDQHVVDGFQQNC